MPRFGLKRRGLSFSGMANRLPAPSDPLDFLNAGRSGPRTRNAVTQIHGAIHGALADSARALEPVFERLRPEGTISDRAVMEAHSDVRTEFSRASSAVSVKRDQLLRDITVRLERMYLQQLINAPDQEPPVSQWADMTDRLIRRELPAVSEPSHSELDVSPNDRRKRLAQWQEESDEWLETLCLNHVGEVVTGLLGELGDFSSSWTDTVNELRRHANFGGRLHQEVTDAELWTFQSDDPTVNNLISGEQAHQTATRILSRFQLGISELQEISEAVQESLDGTPVYGTNRVDTQELEDLLAVATAQRIRATVAADSGFLSLISNGTRFGEELGELLIDMHMGASAMEERMWRIGEYRVGHVDSASGVGITASSLHDWVVRGLGGGRRFAAVEGHPGDNHRFEVQMSTVGAPIADLSLFRDMVNAWYAWHFDDARGANGTTASWLEGLKKESWKLYPDIGEDSGVHNAIIELIDGDLKNLWNGTEDIATRLSNAQPDDEDILNGLVNGSRQTDFL